MSAKRFKHSEDCPCFGDWVEHSKDCKNCECQSAPSEGGEVSHTNKPKGKLGGFGTGVASDALMSVTEPRRPAPAAQPAEVSERLKERCRRMIDEFADTSDYLDGVKGEDVAECVARFVQARQIDLLAELAALREKVLLLEHVMRLSPEAQRYLTELKSIAAEERRRLAALSASGGGQK